MRIKTSLLFFILTLISCSIYAQSNLLPNPLPVYIKGSIHVLDETNGYTKVLLPIDNNYQANPGCYIVCYSHLKNNSVYAVANDVFVVGQIRVPGQSDFNGCRPKNYNGQTVSTIQDFKDLCNKTYPSACNEQCWGGSNSWN